MIEYAEKNGNIKMRLLRQALEASDGNRTRAAKRLGLHRSNLVRMIRDLGIETAPEGAGAGEGKKPAMHGSRAGSRSPEHSPST